MTRFGGIGVEQGEVLFAHYDSGGPLWTGEGRREARAVVRFQQAFRDVPAVHVAPTMWDMDGGANARADAQAVEVGREGFAVSLRTWGDTRIARVRVSWLAIGRAADDDDWDVG